MMTDPMHYHRYRCLNEGTCQDLINEFRCRCPSIRYAGRFCEIDLLNLPGSRSYPAVSVIDNAQGIVDSHSIILLPVLMSACASSELICSLHDAI